MTEIIDQKQWFGFTMDIMRITGRDGNPVPCNYLHPASTEASVPCVIATHGATSSKHEWTEIDGYTKGGNITRELLAHGIAVLAMDLHYHGDNNTQHTNNHNIFEGDNWDDFFHRSVADIHTVIDFAAHDESLDSEKIAFAGYSLAGVFGFWMANHGAPLTTMLLCVPGPKRDSSVYYAPNNNMDALGDISILQVSAEKDEYIPLEDAKWLYSQIPVAKKKFLLYGSGHSLPAEYIPEAVAWLTTELRASAGEAGSAATIQS